MKKINFKMNPDTDKRLGQNDADPLQVIIGFIFKL